MVQRYGDFVLYRPPFKPSTLLLWAGPALLLVVGLVGLIRYLRRRARTLNEQTPLNAEDARRADALLQNPEPHA